MLQKTRALEWQLVPSSPGFKSPACRSIRGNANGGVRGVDAHGVHDRDPALSVPPRRHPTTQETHTHPSRLPRPWWSVPHRTWLLWYPRRSQLERGGILAPHTSFPLRGIPWARPGSSGSSWYRWPWARWLKRHCECATESQSWEAESGGRWFAICRGTGARGKWARIFRVVVCFVDVRRIRLVNHSWTGHVELIGLGDHRSVKEKLITYPFTVHTPSFLMVFSSTEVILDSNNTNISLSDYENVSKSTPRCARLFFPSNGGRVVELI